MNIYLRGVYRMFAAWFDSGEQCGAHLRGERGVRSQRFDGNHNWIHLDVIAWDAMPALIAESRRIAAKRGAGRPVPLDVYKPLAKAVAAAQQKPGALHAGGPRAKILSGERDLATAVCRRCFERLAHLRRAEDNIESLMSLLAQGVGPEVWWPAVKAQLYGTPGAPRIADAAESAPLQMLRAMGGAANSGSQSCMPFATQALLRAVKELEATESAEAACAFLVEIDELVIESEFAAALAKHAKQQRAIERVLWRGGDAKGFPAWWLVRIDAATYGLLGKIGKRWTWFVDNRDAVFASIPDEHFEDAVEIATERDSTR